MIIIDCGAEGKYRAGPIPVAHRQQGRMVFLAVRQFAVDERGDQRKCGDRLPVGRGIVSQAKPPILSVR